MAPADPKPEGAKPKPPTAADVARIPVDVRANAVRMFKLAAVDREHRKVWYALREAHKAGKAAEDGLVLQTTLTMWDNEAALAAAAAVYRDHLAENDRRPPAERWSVTALSTWVALTQAAPKPQ